MRKVEGTMKQKKKLGIIIAIVAAVLVVGVMIFFALKPNGINSQEETSDEKVIMNLQTEKIQQT